MLCRHGQKRVQVGSKQADGSSTGPRSHWGVTVSQSLPQGDQTHALLAYRWTIETEIPIMESEKNVHMVVLTLERQVFNSDAYIPDSFVRQDV